MRPSARNCLVGLLAAFALNGCYASYRVAPLPVPIVLVSPSLFVLRPTDASPADSIEGCVATRVEARVREVRGDTIFLIAPRILARPRLFGTCLWTGDAHVVISDHPDLRAEGVRLSAGRSLRSGGTRVLRGRPAAARNPPPGRVLAIRRRDDPVTPCPIPVRQLSNHIKDGSR